MPGPVQPLAARRAAARPPPPIARPARRRRRGSPRSASGPSSVSGATGSPTCSAAIAATNRARTGRRSASATMKRLAAMHDWPLLTMRAFTAVSTARGRSALGSTMNGSLPPSSSTVFLRCLPAAPRRRCPAPSLPVSVTAATRGSAMIAADPLGADQQRLEHALGRAGARGTAPPARARTAARSTRASAGPRCRPSARARRSGPPARTESSTASPPAPRPAAGTAPRRGPSRASAITSGAQERPRRAPRSSGSRPRTSPPPATAAPMSLPISAVIVPPQTPAPRPRRISAARASTAARSATGRRLQRGTPPPPPPAWPRSRRARQRLERAQALAGRGIDTFDRHGPNVTHDQEQATLRTDAGRGADRGAGDVADGRGAAPRPTRSPRCAPASRAASRTSTPPRCTAAAPRRSWSREAIKGIPRRDLFIVSKVLPAERQPRRDACAPASRACAASAPTTSTSTSCTGAAASRWPRRWRALEELVEQGKIRALGVSNFDVDDLEEARGSAAQHADRLQPGALPPAASATSTPSWSATARRTTSRSSATARSATAAFRRRRSAGGRALAAVAARHGATPRQVALAFLAREPPLFTIPKASTLDARRGERRRAATSRSPPPTSPRSTPPSRPRRQRATRYLGHELVLGRRHRLARRSSRRRQ